MRRAAGIAGFTLALVATPAIASPADVVAARAVCRGGTCIVFATVRHADEGWEHYANSFEVLGPDGAVLGKRVLRHPHVDEQPFTRALEGVRIPADVERVRVRAGDSKQSATGEEVEVPVEREG